MPSGASQSISNAGAGYQKRKKKKKTQKQGDVRGRYLWQAGVCWDVPSVIEVSLLYVKAHGSM